MMQSPGVESYEYFGLRVVAKKHILHIRFWLQATAFIS